MTLVTSLTTLSLIFHFTDNMQICHKQTITFHCQPADESVRHELQTFLTQSHQLLYALQLPHTHARVYYALKLCRRHFSTVVWNGRCGAMGHTDCPAVIPNRRIYDRKGPTTESTEQVMIGGVCLFVHPSVACFNLTRERKGVWSPKLAEWKPITSVHVNLLRGHKVKVTGS